MENLAPDGSMVDCFEGPARSIRARPRAMWFLMNIGIRRNDKALIEKAVEISLSVIEYGWDKQYGGIFYFMDCKGHPTQELEWDQKLWWVHIESAIAMLKGYQLTGNRKCLEWFSKLMTIWSLSRTLTIRVVRLPQPAWRSAAAPQRRQVEGLLPRSERTLSDLADAGNYVISTK